MSERTDISFDAALMMALRADAQRELDSLPTPKQFEEIYPDTSQWDERMTEALKKKKHHPVLKRVLIAALTLVMLTVGALAVSADFRRAVYTMIQKFLPIEMQLTYQVDGEPLEWLPDGYSDHYVPNGFEMDDVQKFERAENFLHVYSSKETEESYTVRCSIIQPGQQSLFDNEHTVYETVKVGEADGVLGTSTDEHAPNERTGIARSSATVKFLYGLAGSGSRQKVTIAYDIKWSERPIYVGIDSFGIGWIAADSSSHQLATKTASAVGEVSYCYASTGNSAGLSSSVDMDTSQSGGVVGTPVIINHQNTSTYGKHISGTVGVGTQSNSSNMETIQIFVAYAHSTVSVTFSADVALQWKQVGMSINFTPQKKTTIIARGNATFKYNGQGYQTAGTV